MDRVDEEELVDEAEEAEVEDGDGEPDPAAPTPEPEKAEDVESSLEELLARRPAEDGKAPEEDDDDSMLAPDRDDRVETLSVKVVPQQPTEFVCRKCFLVKHRSQLSDKRRQFCRDCA